VTYHEKIVNFFENTLAEEKKTGYSFTAKHSREKGEWIYER